MSGEKEWTGTYVGNEDARVAVAVSARELDEFARGWDTRLLACDLQLGTSSVELCTAHAVTEMESDDLVASHIVARCKVVWQVDGRNTTVL